MEYTLEQQQQIWANMRREYSDFYWFPILLNMVEDTGVDKTMKELDKIMKDIPKLKDWWPENREPFRNGLVYYKNVVLLRRKGKRKSII